MTGKKKKYWIGGFIVVAAIFLISHYALNLPQFAFLKEYLPVIKRLTMSAFLVVLILLIERALEKIIDAKAETEGIKYNLQRITRLLTIIFIIIVIASFLFQNLYAVAVSFGLISLVLGFALQAPITSFIAWLFIIFRRPFRVGDRIQIDGFKGDVIEIGYLDTILEECSGVYLGNDRKSGRLVHFPNSIILRSEVVNYSGPFIPFIWNETAIQIAYTSDLPFVESCLLQAADEDFSERFPEKSSLGNEPEVYFRVNNFAWLEAVVSYPVEPTDTTGRRTRILKRALPLLNAQPDKVQFPEGTHR
ncbi:MAG: mechanosensitive ion channel family protein [Crocinitomicaceae bacterium]|nr:mechanosensitive ion channel family protein [Crocinitomicaceae bacterium]